MSVITYIDHSGVSVETPGYVLAFDDVKGEWPRREGKKSIVFVSHKHGDHFSPAIFENSENTEYVLPPDISKKWPGKRIKSGEALALYDDLRVFAYGSTDIGVSYFVEAEGTKIFHSGDLNWWHWQDESTPEEVKLSEFAFMAIMETLPNPETNRIDIAFFPVDPRLKTNYDAGARRFIEMMKPRVFVPIHFWGDAHSVIEFSKLSFEHTRIIPLTERFQTCEI